MQLRRAYQLVDRSDELMVLKQFEDASQTLAQALTLAPQLVELKFWAGLNRLMGGQEEAGQQLLQTVFAQEPIWKTLLPRLVKAGLLTEELHRRIHSGRSLVVGALAPLEATQSGPEGPTTSMFFY